MSSVTEPDSELMTSTPPSTTASGSPAQAPSQSVPHVSEDPMQDPLYAAEKVLLSGELSSRYTIKELIKAEREYTDKQTSIQDLGTDEFSPYKRAYHGHLSDAAHILGGKHITRKHPEFPVCELVARTLTRLQGKHRKPDQGWRDWSSVYTAGPASGYVAPWWAAEGIEGVDEPTARSDEDEIEDSGPTDSPCPSAHNIEMSHLQSYLTWLASLATIDRAAHRSYLQSASTVSDKGISSDPEEALNHLCSKTAWNARLEKLCKDDGGVARLDERVYARRASGWHRRFGRRALASETGGMETPQ